jgi:hypothetical protein
MVKRNFTEKEKIVFYGIINYPGINDNALSNIIDINPSTIATIRNKLKKQDYFKVIRIPYLQNCGFELFTISYDRLYSPNLPEAPSSILGNIYKRISNYFYLLSAPDSWFSLGIFQNYLNLKKINEISRYNKFKNGLQEDTEKQIIFPFGLTKIYNFFDFGQIIRNFFGLDVDLSNKTTESTEDIMKKISGQSILDKTTNDSQIIPPKRNMDITHLDSTDFHDFTFDIRTDLKLTKAEREVFLALIQYPDLSDFAINKIISISATSINNIRKKFESQSIIKQRIIPNLSLLGFELITLTHLKFKSYGNISSRIEVINRILTKKPSFLYISSNTDEIILAAYKNFSEYQHINEEMLRIYRDKDLLASEPRTLLFPLSESVIIKSHSYVPLVNQFLGRGKSIINSVLEIIGKKIGETGKQILIKHLDSSDMLPDEITAKDIPQLIQIIQEVMTPIFGEKSANEIANKIKKMEKK